MNSILDSEEKFRTSPRLNLNESHEELMKKLN